MAGIVTDTWGAEVRPNNCDDAAQPWHWIAIPIMGLTVGEIFDLGELAEDCAADSATSLCSSRLRCLSPGRWVRRSIRWPSSSSGELYRLMQEAVLIPMSDEHPRRPVPGIFLSSSGFHGRTFWGSMDEFQGKKGQLASEWRKRRAVVKVYDPARPKPLAPRADLGFNSSKQ